MLTNTFMNAPGSDRGEIVLHLHLSVLPFETLPYEKYWPTFNECFT